MPWVKPSSKNEKKGHFRLTCVAQKRRCSLLKVRTGRSTGRGLPKITLGMTGLRGNVGRDDGIEEPFWGPSTNIV